MICLAIGLGVLGFAAMRHARRCHHGGRWRHHHYRRRWMLHALLERIDASPAQERAILTELERLQDRVWGARRGIGDARGDLAAAIRGASVDDAALGAALGRIDAATSEVRGALIDAVRGVHGLLDEQQRGQLADMLDSGRFWRRGPYR